jgi:hypothetical protein
MQEILNEMNEMSEQLSREEINIYIDNLSQLLSSKESKPN